MTPNEKAQRLALLTDIKFQIHNVTGELLSSESPIDQAIIDQAMNMTDDEFKKRIYAQRKQVLVREYRNNLPIRCAYKSYIISNPLGMSFDDFVGSVLDDLEQIRDQM